MYHTARGMGTVALSGRVLGLRQSWGVAALIGRQLGGTGGGTGAVRKRRVFRG